MNIDFWKMARIIGQVIIVIICVSVIILAVRDGLHVLIDTGYWFLWGGFASGIVLIALSAMHKSKKGKDK